MARRRGPTLHPGAAASAPVLLRGGALIAAVSAMAYGSLAVLTKLAYDEGWNVPSLLVARFGLASLVILPFALRQPFSRRGMVGGLLVGGIGYAGTTALYFPSLLHLDAAMSSFLLYLAPVLVAVLSTLLLRERIDARLLVALGLAIAGLAIIASGAWTGRMPPLGVALAAGSAVVYAFTVVASRRLVADVPWAQSSLWVVVGAFLTYVVFSTASGQLAVPRSTPGLLYALGIGTLATGFALSLFFIALDRIGAARTSVISTLEPVSTLVLAAIFLQENPGFAGILGGMLITAGAALVASAAPPAAHE